MRRGDDWMAGGAMGDVLAELYKEGHIKDHVFVLASRLLHDMQRAHGDSVGIAPQYAERVQTSLRERMRPPGGGDPDAFARVDYVLSQLLAHERRDLEFMILRREMPRGALSDYGRQHSAYATNKTARSFTVGKFVGTLMSLAELYPYGEWQARERAKWGLTPLTKKQTGASIG